MGNIHPQHITTSHVRTGSARVRAGGRAGGRLLLGLGGWLM